MMGIHSSDGMRCPGPKVPRDGYIRDAIISFLVGLDLCRVFDSALSIPLATTSMIRHEGGHQTRENDKRR
jgi:hypothetical protein